MMLHRVKRERGGGREGEDLGSFWIPALLIRKSNKNQQICVASSRFSIFTHWQTVRNAINFSSIIDFSSSTKRKSGGSV